MILPDQSDRNYQLYRDFVDQWIKGNEEKYEIKNQREIKNIPSDKCVWILGENKFQLIVNKVLQQLYR